MDKILRLTLLLDFYGDLLTEKQRGIFESYFCDNLSLAEIAEINGVSRQSVNDLLRRTEKILSDYEKKLLLVQNHLSEKDKIDSILEHIDNLVSNGHSGLSELRKMVEALHD